MPKWSLTKALLLLSVFQLAASAKCKSVALPSRYHFIQQVDVHPYQKVYHIGDTLTFEYTDTGRVNFDSTSHALVKTDSFSYRISAGLVRMDNAGKPIPSGGYFLVSNNGAPFSPVLKDISDGVTIALTNVGCDGGPDLHYSVKIIPRQAGIYSLALILYNYNGVTYCYNGAPARAGFDFLFNLADCNADLLAGTDIVASEMPTYTALVLEKREFFFKVE